MSLQVLDRYPGLPVGGVGVGYLSVAIAHLWRARPDVAKNAIEAGLLAALALGFCYGALRLSRLDLEAEDSPWILGWVLLAACVGLVVSGTLVVLQQSAGVAVQNVPVLIATASAATGVVGLGLVENRQRLLAEQAESRAQTVTVARLNRRITVLHRVLRHNLRNETTIIHGHIDLLQDAERDVRTRDALQTIDEHTQNVDKLSQQAKRLQRLWRTESFVETDLVDAVRESANAVTAEHDHADISLDVPESAVTTAHPHFRFGVREAIENAVVHNDPETNVDVSLVRNGDAFVLEVADDGDGIPDDELAAIREESEDPLTHCSGLGLWVLYWAIVRSDGSLEFRESETGGTTVGIRIPSTSA